MFFNDGDWYLSTKSTEEFDGEVGSQWMDALILEIKKSENLWKTSKDDTKNGDEKNKERLQYLIIRARKAFICNDRWVMMQPREALEEIKKMKGTKK